MTKGKIDVETTPEYLAAMEEFMVQVAKSTGATSYPELGDLIDIAINCVDQAPARVMTKARDRVRVESRSNVSHVTGEMVTSDEVRRK